jgi:hypothetical protein
MNLLQVRTWFVQESGRYDLVVDATTFADNGANNYLNAGLRMLDRMQTHPLTIGHNWQKAESGTKYVIFPDCRAVKKVFATKVSDVCRTELTKEKLEYVKAQHFLALAGDADAGTPLYYAPGTFRLAPESTMAIGDIDIAEEWLDYIGESPFNYNGILFTPACDEDYGIEVWGYFYTPTMSADTDENYWTTQHPELLVMAGQMTIEKFMRNTEGVKDWLGAIQMELTGIDRDLVEEEIADVNQMEG